MYRLWPAQVISVGMMKQNMVNYACLSGGSVHVEVQYAYAEKSLMPVWNVGD